MTESLCVCVCVCGRRREMESMYYTDYELLVIVKNRTRRWQ
jgi:hypothetical protein